MQGRVRAVLAANTPPTLPSGPVDTQTSSQSACRLAGQSPTRRRAVSDPGNLKCKHMRLGGGPLMPSLRQASPCDHTS